MQYARFVPIAMLAFAVACSDTATSPTSVGGPLFAVSAGTFGEVTTLNAAGAPGGGHIQTGGPVSCIVNAQLVVTCDDAAYEISGIGNTNANATLSASYSATVDCTNKGGNLVEVKSQPQTAPASTGSLRAKNGRLTVPQLTSSAPSQQQFFAAATCPNGNWTKSLADDPILESFTYTLTFVGFGTPAISISSS